MSKNFLRQRGQAMVLYALLMPLLFLFVGVGLDLGWYYLNVSRLQNAADAAALAGAKVIVDASNNIYFTNGLTTNSLPGDILDYKKISTYNFGQLRRYEEKLPGFNSEAFINSRVMAENYTRKNLADYNKPDDTSSEKNKLTAVDGWSISVKDKDKEVKGTVSLYAKVFDVRSDIITPMYYTVELNEKIRHFFMPGWFDDMNAPVRAVVLLRPHDTDLFSNVQRLESKEVIGNWEYQNYYKNKNEVYSGNWGKSVQDTNVHYESGNAYRTEKVKVGKGQTSRNEGNTQADSLFLDFRAEVLLQMRSDWDIGYTPTLRNEDQRRKTMAYQFTDGWGANLAQNKRVLFTADFGTPYDTRDSYLKKSETDPLWVRIESDPILDMTYVGKPGHEVYNSVRQVTFNFNNDNTATYPEGHKYAGQYKYRPYVIFYDGPERIDYAVDKDGNEIRKSQPVVVNLNADFNGIIFAPNSPAIINGNGHTWNGFIIAKEFLAAKTAEDFTNNEAGYTKVTDSYNDTLYLKWDDAKTKSELEAIYGSGYKIGTDSNGNLVVIPPTVTNYKKGNTNNAKNLSFTIDGVQYTIERKWLEQEPLKGATTTPSTNVVKIFRKVTCDNEEKYIDEVGTDYYQLVDDGKNPIIVDRNGNIQTKELPAGSYKQNPYLPLDADWEKIVDGHPYRIKSEENVYEREEAFNLSNDSYYNSFNIPELKRKVYTYLDGYLTENPSPDMFFTTLRASWID